MSSASFASCFPGSGPASNDHRSVPRAGHGRRASGPRDLRICGTWPVLRLRGPYGAAPDFGPRLADDPRSALDESPSQLRRRAVEVNTVRLELEGHLRASVQTRELRWREDSALREREEPDATRGSVRTQEKNLATARGPWACKPSTRKRCRAEARAHEGGRPSGRGPDASRTPRCDTPERGVGRWPCILAYRLLFPAAEVPEGAGGLAARSSPGSMQLEGAARTRPRPRSAVRRHLPHTAVQANEDRPPPNGRTVDALSQAGRNNVYCSSPGCVSQLLAQGWKLSGPGQLAALVKELAQAGLLPRTNRRTTSHDHPRPLDVGLPSEWAGSQSPGEWARPGS